MSKATAPKISIIAPCHNEEPNVEDFYQTVSNIFKSKHLKKYLYEIIFIDDGSEDKTIEIIKDIQKKVKEVKLIKFTRNFGKEYATTAGIENCTGNCAIILDTDLQYPIEEIPKFIIKWEEGYKVVTGIRDSKKTANIIEKIGSFLFLKIMKSISETDTKGSDFRLIDRKVIENFKKLKEKERIARVLIDWMGYKTAYIKYKEKPRKKGNVSFNFSKRLNLAVNSFVSHSLAPLKFVGALGVFITFFSIVVFFIILSDIIFDFNIGFSGTFMLGTLNTFLIGLVLTCLGLVAYYVANIKRETINRPNYIIEEKINF